MRAYDVRIDSSAYTAGLPSLSGIYGFTHAIERNIKELIDDEFFVTGFSYLVHNINYSEGTKRFSQSKRKIKNSNDLAAPMEDLKLAIIDQTIIIEVESKLTASDFYNSDKLNDVFSKLRFMGGHFNIQMPHSNQIKGGCLEVLDATDGGFSDALKACNQNGYIVEDATYLVENASNQLQYTLDLIKQPKLDKSTGKPFSIVRPQGYFVPIHIGYVGLDKPSLKHHTRDNNDKHIYAEPVIGVARCRTIRSAIINLTKSNDLQEDPTDCRFIWQNSALNPEDFETKNLYIVYGVNP